VPPHASYIEVRRAEAVPRTIEVARPARVRKLAAPDVATASGILDAYGMTTADMPALAHALAFCLGAERPAAAVTKRPPSAQPRDSLPGRPRPHRAGRVLLLYTDGGPRRRTPITRLFSKRLVEVAAHDPSRCRTGRPQPSRTSVDCRRAEQADDITVLALRRVEGLSPYLT